MAVYFHLSFPLPSGKWYVNRKSCQLPSMQSWPWLMTIQWRVNIQMYVIRQTAGDLQFVHNLIDISRNSASINKFQTATRFKSRFKSESSYMGTGHIVQMKVQYTSHYGQQRTSHSISNYQIMVLKSITLASPIMQAGSQDSLNRKHTILKRFYFITVHKMYLDHKLQADIIAYELLIVAIYYNQTSYLVNNNSFEHCRMHRF